MEAKIISGHTLPDTYGEWWIDYLDNVIMPYFTEPLLKTREFAKKHILKTEAIQKEILETKKYYNIDQPTIEHVEITFSIKL